MLYTWNFMPSLLSLAFIISEFCEFLQTPGQQKEYIYFIESAMPSTVCYILLHKLSILFADYIQCSQGIKS